MAILEHIERVKQDSRDWNHWRHSFPNIMPNLSGADLTGANLSDFDLSNANLSATDFRGANLTGAYVAGAHLKGASFFQAELIETDLSGANLVEACLAFANLTDANLKGANLSHAALQETIFRVTNSVADTFHKTNFTLACAFRTVFADLDLSTAIGLETVVHGWTSTLGLDTLICSKGKIPRAFLSGCGVPEEFIRHIDQFFEQTSVD